ncbi:hypothetical protein PT974_07648 [Cladobotryum mycophilum]|uniref:Uncharacterized protein n=1 Tax=Cladobotryum mycophilum TaxID=491253 RepID=A0ABR0SR64_9HYPO
MQSLPRISSAIGEEAGEPILLLPKQKLILSVREAGFEPTTFRDRSPSAITTAPLPQP